MSYPREETMDGYRSLFIISLALAMQLGCHYRDPSVDLLEGELRYMEDQVYLLEGELHKRCTQLDACRNQCVECVPADSHSVNSPSPAHKAKPSSAQPYGVMSPNDPEPVPAAPSVRELEKLPADGYELVEPMPAYDEQPSVEMPVQTDEESSATDPDPQPTRASDEPVPARPPVESVPAPAEYEMLDPEIEIPDTNGSSTTPEYEPISESPGELPGPPLLEAPTDDDADSEPADSPLDFSFRSVTDEEGVAVADSGIDAHVSHVVAHAELVTQRGFDDEVTDADILVVVEPRNKDGQYVELTGPVSVVVLDGKREGDAARLARWDYDAGSARRAIRESALGRGIHLELNWPDEIPDSDDLHLFVRYTTIEDQKLETDVKLAENPGREMSKGWQVVDRAPRLNDGPSTERGWGATSGSSLKKTPKKSALESGFTLQPIATAAGEHSSTKVQEASATKPPETAEPIAKPEWSPYR